MSQTATMQSAVLAKDALERKHRRRIRVAWIVSIACVAAFTAYGFDYYRLGSSERPFSPKHFLLRPSGPVGVNLGTFSVLLFFLIYLYPLRKKWGWLGRQGNSRHWLDFHVILGTVAPLVVALHSSFKFGGIAGMAFWIMMAVTLSGFIGRYLYSQIPRTLNAAELSMKEIQELEVKLRWAAEEKHEDIGLHLIDLYELPAQDRVAHASLLRALCWMMWIDIKRPFQVSLLRLEAAGAGSWFFSLGGMLPTRESNLESAIRNARRQGAVVKRVLFLSRTQEVFKLWHVVHRPFSYSFAMLAIIHIAVVLGMGYM